MSNYQLALKDVAYRLHLRENLKEEHYQGDASLVKLQELVDKATPKKVIVIENVTRVLYSTTYDYVYKCPICKTILWTRGMSCPNNDCRQAIDWSNNE